MRFTLSTHTASASDHVDTDDLAEAQAAFHAFRVANALDSDAQAGIWDSLALRYVADWRGGQKFGPRDTRHPLEAMFAKAIAAGHRVVISGPEAPSAAVEMRRAA